MHSPLKWPGLGRPGLPEMAGGWLGLPEVAEDCGGPACPTVSGWGVARPTRSGRGVPLQTYPYPFLPPCTRVLTGVAS